MSRIKVSDPADLIRLLGHGKARETVTDARGKVRTLAPPLPRHEPGEIQAEATPHRVPYDSKEEEEFAGILDRRKEAGEILQWAFQPERFHIGDGAWFTPDFRVIDAASKVIFYEVKGGKIREAARVRFLVAASQHPYRFIMIQKQAKKDGGEWKVLIDSHAKTA